MPTPTTRELEQPDSNYNFFFHTTSGHCGFFYSYKKG